MNQKKTYPTLDDWLSDLDSQDSQDEVLFHATNAVPFNEATSSDWDQFQSRRNRSTNHRRIRTRYHRLQYLTAACVAALIGCFLYFQWTSPTIHATAVGETAVISLDDGSQVTLFPNSRLEWEHGFNQSHRNIKLSGQAYFTVQPANHAFVVETERSEVEAIGTEFSVFDYADISYFCVNISEGVVQVRTDTSLMLSEGAVFSQVNGIVEVSTSAITNENVSIIGTPSEIASLMEKHFKITVDIAPSIQSESYRFSMNPQKQQTSLETLAELVQGKLQKTETGYLIIP